MDIEKETAVFEAACENHAATIEKMPHDSAEREAYAEGLADGVHFALNAK